MTGNALSRTEAWFARSREKALALLEPHVAAGDELVHFGLGWQYPLDVLTWLPFIGSLIEMRKKRFLLAATRTRFVILRLRTFRFEEIGAEHIPITTIRDSAVRRFPLYCNLVLALDGGRTLTFKEMSYEDAAGLKDAADQAQGRPGTAG